MNRISALVAIALVSLLGLPAPSGHGSLPPVLARRAAPVESAPGLLWRFATGGHQIISAPAVGPDGTLYAASNDGVLYAVSPDGRRLWSLRTGVTAGTMPPARSAVDRQGNSYWNIHGSVAAIDRHGRLRWLFLAAGGGSPVLAGKYVLFAAGPYLYAIDTQGQAAWRAAIGAAGPATGAPTPAVGPDGTAYVATPDGSLYAIAANGLRRWVYRVAEAGRAVLYSPAVAGDGTVYLDAFSAGRGTLYALSPGGGVRWRVTIPAGGDLTRGADGTVYAATHLAVAVSSHGRLLWQRTVDASAPPLALSAGLIVIPTLSPPSLLALDAQGRLRWRLPLAATPVGSPAGVSPDRLYLGDYTGALVALAAGAKGSGRAINGAPPAGAPLDLGAANPPFIVQSGRITWRVTIDQRVERSLDGKRWDTVLTPGVSTFDRQRNAYRNARYASVSFLAVSPHDRRGLYVGTIGALGDYLTAGAGGADGGLYYSADGASRWVALSGGLSFTYEPRLHVPTFGLDSLVFDPAQRGRMYAQTLSAFGTPGHDAGLYRSTDGGRHWRLAVDGLQAISQGNPLIGSYNAYPPGALLVDRNRTDVLFLITATGFYRSADAAGHWTLVSGVRYTDPASVAVRIGARGAVRVYADRGTYASDDYGAHWRAVPR